MGCSFTKRISNFTSRKCSGFVKYVFKQNHSFFRITALLEMKLVSLQLTDSCYLLRLPKDVCLQHNRLKFFKLRIFVPNPVCHRNAAFNHFEHIITKNDMFMHFDWTRYCKMFYAMPTLFF